MANDILTNDELNALLLGVGYTPKEASESLRITIDAVLNGYVIEFDNHRGALVAKNQEELCDLVGKSILNFIENEDKNI